MRARRESRVASIAIRLGINAIALWLAATWVHGFTIHGWQSLVAMAAIFGVVNAFVRPIAQILGFPITCLTLGLFVLIINTAMLALAAGIANAFDLQVELDGFRAAFLAALLVTLTSWLLSVFVGRPLRRALR